MVEWIALVVSVLAAVGTFVSWRRAESRANDQEDRLKKQEHRNEVEWEAGRVKWEVEGPPEVLPRFEAESEYRYRFVNTGREKVWCAWIDAESISTVATRSYPKRFDVEPGDVLELTLAGPLRGLDKVELKWQFESPKEDPKMQVMRLPAPPPVS